MRFARPAWAMLLLALSILAPIAEAQPTIGARQLRLAVDPLLERSGVLARLVPAFEEARGVRVTIQPLPGKEALELGSRGGTDLVWVSTPRLELQYLNQGFYVDRRPVLYTEQVLVGPGADPAGVRARKDATAAFLRIAHQSAAFVSRTAAGESRSIEAEIWRRARLTPRGPWYLRTDLAKDDALSLAAKRGAYMLVDRAAAEAFASTGQLAIVLQGMRPLRREYSAMLVDPNRFPTVNHADARAFAEFLTSPASQAAIGGVDLDHDSRPDFFPAGAGR